MCPVIARDFVKECCSIEKDKCVSCFCWKWVDYSLVEITNDSSWILALQKLSPEREFYL